MNSPPPHQAFTIQQWLMIYPLTFELWDLSCCTLGKTLMAGIAGQRHGNTTAAQQESNLLAACILLDDTGSGGTQKIQSGVTIKGKLLCSDPSFVSLRSLNKKKKCCNDIKPSSIFFMCFSLGRREARTHLQQSQHKGKVHQGPESHETNNPSHFHQ